MSDGSLPFEGQFASRASDTVVFVQHQQKTVEPYQMRAVVNLEAHTYDQYHLDETDLFINYHSEADVVVTYGYELRPLFWLRDAFGDEDVLNLNKSIFNKWCCATYECDELL